MSNVLNIPSPITKIDISEFVGFRKEIYVKRDDLIHPIISGNKWRKLKFNLKAAKSEKHDTILTFGGAYSNHIAASAFAAKVNGLKSIGIIRGEEVSNSTLKSAKAFGMHLHFISRKDYKLKHLESFISELKIQFGKFYLIPEGGANRLGVMGCEETIQEIEGFEFDIVALAAGTGTTAAGILSSIDSKTKCMVFPALKGGEFIKEEILQFSNKNTSNLQLILDYHFGGYAKFNSKLIEFILAFYRKTGLKLDQVYTSKMMFGLVDLLKKGEIPNKAKILAIHTGGLQGNTNIKFD